MKQIALDLAARVSDPDARLNLLREYLQASALRSLHESGAFSALSFVGGTALRFLYDLPRFSEDLDFSLESSNTYEPEKWLAKLKRDLSFSGFDAEVSWNDRKTAQVAWVRVSGLLFESALADRAEQKLSIKLKIDTRPPPGAQLETRLVNRHLLFAVRHHSLPCLMAGKVRALLTRSFLKGRDWYDLAWYLSCVPPVQPDSAFLATSLAQGTPTAAPANADWRKGVLGLLVSLDQDALLADVAPFLERPGDRALLTRENLIGLLQAEQ